MESSTIEEPSSVDSLLQKLVLAKTTLAVLQKEKRQLLEELHRQCLEGEVEPKKRIRPYLDRRKKLMKTQSSNAQIASITSTEVINDNPIL